MGFWRSARGINGDSWADEMDRCMDALSTMTVKDSKFYGEGHHEITMQEFADLVEFCSRGHLVVEVRHPGPDSIRPLSELHHVIRLDTEGKDIVVETYPNRGQIQCDELCEA
jgi:hypothetical protein